MPGITGIIRKRPYEGIEEDLGAMIDAMRHERFYRSGQYLNGDIGVYVGWMCHERSFSDCMPLVSRLKDSILIFQGESFADHDTLSTLPCSNDGVGESSAQYLLKMYESMGTDFIRRLNGWFCGVLVDLRSRKVTLFNDRYGMSRVYFHSGEHEFLFASEAKSLLKVRPRLRAIQPAALAEYLRYNCVTAGQTLFKDISLLPTGSSWVFGDGVLRKKQRYFDPTDWERQPILTGDEFYEKFADTVTKVVPRYVNGPQEAALALTAGLDTRLIAAVLQSTDALPSCYTFGGTWGETLDIKKARQIAAICGQPHETIKLDDEFFKDFPAFAQRSVTLSDGAHDAFGAHDVYLNKVARQIAPIRLTGKFGSEVVKTRRLIPWLSYNGDFIQSDLKPFLDALQPRDRFRQKYSLATLLFEEIPWYESGRVTVEQSQLTLRTPYLDNDLVKLMFQAESRVRAAGQLQPRYIREKSPKLNAILTNMGGLGNGGHLLTKVRYLMYRALFKMEYYYLFATPHWLTRIDRKLEKFKLEKIVAGREKFEGYRIWIRSHLADFIVQTLSNPNAHYVQFFDRRSVQQMVARHLAGTHNYLNEINKVLTIELVYASLIHQQPGKIGRFRSDDRSVNLILATGAQVVGLANGTPSPKDYASILPPITRPSPRPVNADAAMRIGHHSLQSFGPTFLGIGSMRCGSTWLYEVLKCHPDIQMSHCKEMDFFFMPQMLQHDLDWYAAHFKAEDGGEAKPVRGEISPRYARLKTWQIKQIQELLPELRIILTLRHPIERVWSQTLFDFGRLQGRDVRKVGLLELLRQLERPRSKLSSDYYRTIRIWTEAFGPEALHIAFFEQLRDDPERYINGVLRHIGAATPWAPPERFIKKKILATKSLVGHERDIPEVVRWYIADQLLEPTERLNELLDGRISTWVDEMRIIRGRTRLSWRIMRELNRTVLSAPERLAYEAYHALLDVSLWRRWRRLQASYESGINSL